MSTRMTVAQLAEQVTSMQSALAKLIELQTTASKVSPEVSPASIPRSKGKVKEDEELSGPFVKMDEAQIQRYLLTVFQQRNKANGIWLYHTNVGRKKAIWSMAHHLTYYASYDFSTKAAAYAQRILATDPRNEAALKALKSTEKL